MKFTMKGPRVRVQCGGGTRSIAAVAGVSLRCGDCGKLRYSTAHEVARRSRLRCLECGGLLAESKATEKRNRALVVLRHGASPLDDTRDIPCPTCDAMFRTGTALKLHREERHGLPKRVDPEWN